MRSAAPIIIALALINCAPATAGTRLFGFYGLGGQWFSTGIDQIADQARNIPGVTHIAIYNYWETQGAARDINNVPSSDKVVLFGYSCGANSTTVVAAGVHRHVNTITSIQQSAWCGGTDVTNNTSYGQMTYNPNCWQTLGLGCKPYTAASGFTGRILNINRPDMHGYADENPDAQADVLRAISWTANGTPPYIHVGHGGLAVRRGVKVVQRGVAMVKHGVQEIVRYHGEAP
jgi:hypothetical protein